MSCIGLHRPRNRPSVARFSSFLRCGRSCQTVRCRRCHGSSWLDIVEPGGSWKVDSLCRVGGVLVSSFGRTAETDLWQGYLSANYHALQVSVNRQFSKGLLVKGAYTYSKAINFTDDDGWAGLNWNDPTVFRRNRAAAGYNTPHIFQIAYVYELPLGKGKPYANDGVASAILGGWQTSGTFSAIHGQPFSLTASGASLNAVAQRQTPDQVGPIKKLGGIGPGQPFYDPTAFAAPTGAVYGTVGRNTLYGPGSVNFDFSLIRTFKLTERFDLQFRTDASNLFNTPHFCNPGGCGGGVTTSRASSSFLTVTAAKNEERQFRFGLRLSF